MRKYFKDFGKYVAAGAIAAILLSIIIIPAQISARGTGAVGGEIFFIAMVSSAVSVVYARIEEKRSKSKNTAKIYKLQSKQHAHELYSKTA